MSDAEVEVVNVFVAEVGIAVFVTEVEVVNVFVAEDDIAVSVTGVEVAVTVA